MRSSKSLTRSRMRTRLIAVTLSIFAVATATIQFKSVKGDLNHMPQPSATQPSEAQGGVIDGSKEPERIPDNVALGIVFRVIHDLQSRGNEESLRAYIDHLGFGSKDIKDEKQFGDLIQAARLYGEQVSLLDGQAKTIKIQSAKTQSDSTKMQLQSLQWEKTQLLAKTASSLDDHLGVEAASRLRAGINERIKPLIKIKQNSDGQ